MLIKYRKSTAETCIVVGCSLVVFVTVLQIFSVNYRSSRSSMFGTKYSVSSERKPSNVQLTNEAKATAKRHRMLWLQAKAKLRKRTWLELQSLDRAMSKLRREKSMSPNESSAMIDNKVYARKVADIIKRSEIKGLWINKNPYRSGKAQSRLSDRVKRRNTSRSSLNDLHENINSIKITANAAQRFGLPLTYEPPTTTQALANGGILDKNRVSSLKHFQELDKFQENKFKRIIDEAVSFEDGNFSMTYDENFIKVKNQLHEGTELYVDEASLLQSSELHLGLCLVDPESLVGNTTDIQLNQTVYIEDLVENNEDLKLGGEWKPAACISRHRVAIIIPYRDRWNHLKVLLYYLIPTLKRQQINFRIFVVEQFGNETFNKGSIMNAAFREALKLFDFQCVTFHDVDLVPEDDRNMYTCTEQPKHMSQGIDKFHYILPYQGLVGGVLMFKREHFQLVNGYSNMYWGWGAEDDDMTTRILFHGLRIYRPPSNIAKYKMVKHDGRKSSAVAVRMKLLRSAAKRSKMEGLNNVKYKLLFTHKEKLFTHFVVDIGNPLAMSS